MAHPEHPDHHRYTYLLSLWQEGRSWRAALRPVGRARTSHLWLFLGAPLQLGP